MNNSMVFVVKWSMLAFHVKSLVWFYNWSLEMHTVLLRLFSCVDVISCGGSYWICPYSSGLLHKLYDYSVSVNHPIMLHSEQKFLFWMEHCGIWNSCILGVVNYVNSLGALSSILCGAGVVDWTISAIWVLSFKHSHFPQIIYNRHLQIVRDGEVRAVLF